MTHDPQHPDLAAEFSVDVEDTSNIDQADDQASDFVLPGIDTLPELSQDVLDSMLDVAMDPATPEPEGTLVPEADSDEFEQDFSDYSDDAVFDARDDIGEDDFLADDAGADELPLEVEDADDSAHFDDSSDLI